MDTEEEGILWYLFIFKLHYWETYWNLFCIH